MALLKCNRNYIANGSVTAFCESNSKWNRKIGKCPYTTMEAALKKLVSGTRAIFICDLDLTLKDEYHHYVSMSRQNLYQFSQDVRYCEAIKVNNGTNT
uniref:Sushi domain-containing protein n=1 Tax=Wuchereria bancrofti TaxID=6293 RepID=A0A1I8EEI4_WUCBA